MIGIVIINYRTWEITERCIASIRKCCTLPYRVYVIDNHSPNDSFIKLSEAYSNADDVAVRDSGFNGGYGFALNRGFELAISDGCKAVIASNNDIIYQRGSIEKLFDTLKRYPEVAVVGAQQVNIDGTKQCSASYTYYKKRELILWYAPFSHRFFKGDKVPQNDCVYEPADVLERIAYPIGGCYMFNADVLGKGSFYDERVFMYGEEPIIGEKLVWGHRVALLRTDAEVIHKHHGTTGGSMSFYQKTAAPSILLFCMEYAKLSRFEIRIHKLLFYTQMSIKCLIIEEYRRDWRSILSALKSNTASNVAT